MRAFWKFATLYILAAVAASCSGGGTDPIDVSPVTLPGGEVVTTATVDQTSAPVETAAAETPDVEPTVVEEQTSVSSEASTTETVADEQTTETTAAETTAAETTEPTAVETTEDSGSATAASLGLKIVSINFATSEVVLMNSGSAAVDISSYTWCNFPEYTAVSGGSVIEPGATATVASTVEITPAAGELGLYRTSDFADPTAIAAYVEWGTPDHQRAAVAIEAGIWSGNLATVDGDVLTNG